MSDIESQLAAMEAKAPEMDDVVDDEDEQVADPGEHYNGAAGERQAAGKGAGKDKAAAADDDDDLPIEEIRLRLKNHKGATASEREARRRESARAEAAENRAAEISANFQRFQAEVRARMNPAPDPEQDLIGAFKYERDQRLRLQQQQAQEQQRNHAQNQQVQYVTNLKRTIDDFEGEFKGDHPDYDEATDHILDLEQKKLELAGYPPAQAEQMAQHWAVNMANQLVRSGKNPAQAAYEMAQTLGWRPRVANESEKLKMIGNGQKASRSLGGGGKSSNGGSSLKGITALNGAAFSNASEKWLDDMCKGR